MATIGTCGNCGGPVQTPDMWGGVIPPVPTCTKCGARAINPYGPAIPMSAPRGCGTPDPSVSDAALKAMAEDADKLGLNY